MRKFAPGHIIRVVRQFYNIIETRRKNNLIELGGWILLDHILWLNKSNGTKTHLYVSDEVSELMNLIGGISFHTHPKNDQDGPDGISAEDRAMACAFGHEVVFTCKGAYLILPVKKIKYERIRKMQDNIEVEAFASTKSEEEAILKMQKIGNEKFKCTIQHIPLSEQE